MLASRNPLGLLSEDTHPVTGEMWGNFPQTYSMVGIINAAVRLSAPWDRDLEGRCRAGRRFQSASRIRARPRPAAWRSRWASVLNKTGGLWFGWSGKIVEARATRPSGELHIQQAGTVNLATIDLSRDGPRQLLPRLSATTCCGRCSTTGSTWRDFDAGYIAGYRRVNQLFARKLLPLLERRRHHLGARLPPDPAGGGAARAGLPPAHRLLPAHPAAAAADPGGHSAATTG